jgi:hypothetical protein
MNRQWELKLIRTRSLASLSLFGLTVLLSGRAMAVLPANATARATQPHYAPGEVIVKYKPGLNLRSIRAMNDLVGAKNKAAVLAHRPARLRLRAGIPVRAAVQRLRTSGMVEYAEPNYYRRPQAACASHPSPTRDCPNDPRFDEQYALDNQGVRPNSIVDADMDMPEAWHIVHDTPDVTVAIIDDGFALDNPDLEANFANTGVSCKDGTCTPNSSAAATSDDETHGTLVDGALAAVGNNNTGISGVFWHGNVLPIKVDLKDNSIAAAINYAVAHGANLINISLGGPNFAQDEFDAIDAARQHGVLVVASANNDDSDTDLAVASYPANYDLPNIIAAAASSPRDDIADFSQWGSFSVDVAAPGTDIVTTAKDGSYVTAAGTSFSSPMTAGVAALIAQHIKDRTGNLPNYRTIKAYLLGGAEIAGSTGQSGIKGRVATGRVDAFNSLQKMSGGILVIKNVIINDDPALSGANDGDGALDPNETVNLKITLDNVFQDETDVTGTLASRNDFATVQANGPRDFGAIVKNGDADGTGSAAFTIKMGSLPTDEKMLFQLDLKMADGKRETRYFYLEAGHLNNGQLLDTPIERTNFDDFQTFHVNVPAGAHDLVFLTHTDNGADIDLLAKYGVRPHYAISLGADPDSDKATFFTDKGTLVSGRADGEESLSVPAPKQGAYHVVVANYALTKHNYRIEACYAPPDTDEVSFNGSYEDAEDVGTEKLTVTRSGSHGAANIDYHTQDESALAGANYKPVSGTLKWANGDSGSKTISVPILNTGKITDKTTSFKRFTVQLSNPTGDAKLGCLAQGEVTLTNAKNPPSKPPPTSNPPPKTPPPTPTPKPTPPKKGKSGGGGFGGLALLALAALIWRRK